MMDLRKIKKLIELVEESGIAELEVRDGEEGIRIARGVVPSAATVAPPPTAPAPASGAAPTPRRQNAPQGTVFEVSAPLAGTFYRAPSPGERPFVTVGQEVAMGDVLCIIESMKMMNQIEAERGGRVLEVLIDDGQPIEAGEILFRLE